MRAPPIVLAAAVVAAAGVVPAAAGAHPARAAAARHCVVWIAPSGGRAPSRMSKMRCYTALARALRLARGRPPKGFPDSKTGLVPDASTLISTDFNGANMSGTSLTWTVSNTNGCNGGFHVLGRQHAERLERPGLVVAIGARLRLEHPLPQHQLRGCGDHLHLLDDGRDEQPDLQRDLEPVTAAAGGPRAGPPAMPVRRPCHTARSSGTP